SVSPECASDRTRSAAPESRRLTCRISSGLAASPRRSPRVQPRCRSAHASSCPPPSGREHVLGRLRREREGTGFGKAYRRLEFAPDLVFHHPQPPIVELTLLTKLSLKQRNRILAFPCFHFCLVARVGLPAALSVGAQAVCLAFDQRRAG